MNSRLPEELQWEPGETPYQWLERNTNFFLTELCNLAFDPGVSAKVRLVALKELICRPLPSKNVYEYQQIGSEVDRMTDEEVFEEITRRLEALKPKGNFSWGKS